MGRILLGHLGRALVTIWLLVSLIFLLSRLALSTTDVLGLPATADLNLSYSGTPERQIMARKVLRHRLGLDAPLFYVSCSRPAGCRPQWHWHGLHNQYHSWLTQLLHGQLGNSFRNDQPVAPRLGAALRCTLPLMGAAVGLTSLLALGLAQLLAQRPWWRAPALAVLTGLHSLPLFVLAATLLLLFANPELLDWFPAGYHTSNSSYNLLTIGAYLVLPLASLVISALPGLTLQLEAALTRELHSNYATTARAKGASEMQVVRHHALRNALLPLITLFTDLLPALAAGAVVVEVLFALPGMGRLLAEAAAMHDLPVLIDVLLLVAGARLVALLLADILYLWVDPRIR